MIARLPGDVAADNLRLAAATIDRLAGQKANSTPRRDRFTIVRWELDALIALLPLLEAATQETTP